MLNLDYRQFDGVALVSWTPADDGASWVDMIKRLLLDSSDDTTQTDGYTLTIPWWSFVAIREKFLIVCKKAELIPGKNFNVSKKAVELLQQAKRSREGYDKAVAQSTIDATTLNAKLNFIGFARPLTQRQIENVGRIAAIPAGATFSVPGAGKTTEALATFFFRAHDDERLLVIAPKNAFAAWDEQVTACMPHLKAQFTRLKGGKEKIQKLLEDDPRFMLITYQQLARSAVTDVIRAHLAQHKSYVFLDESHRIKSGVGKQTARAVLSLAHLPIGKLIMSGTPMPQSSDDLIPQFAFLYPEVATSSEQVIDYMKPIYVRTNKAQLGLPPVTRVSIPLSMAPMQFELYKLYPI